MSEFYVRRAEIEEGRYRPARYARDKRIDSPADWATQIVADRSFEITVVKPYGYEPYSHVLTLAMGGAGVPLRVQLHYLTNFDPMPYLQEQVEATYRAMQINMARNRQLAAALAKLKQDGAE